MGRCVWSRNIKNWCSIYTYDISSLRVNDLTLILLTWRKWWAPNNASKQQMGFNSAFKGLIQVWMFVISPEDGRNCWPKHVAYMRNEWMSEHLCCSIGLITTDDIEFRQSMPNRQSTWITTNTSGAIINMWLSIQKVVQKLVNKRWYEVIWTRGMAYAMWRRYENNDWIQQSCPQPLWPTVKKAWIPFLHV